MQTRLYAQLRPDNVGLMHLSDVQMFMPGQGRFVSAEQLHLTVIHFGIVDEVIASLPDIGKNVATEVDHYIKRSELILGTFPSQHFELQPIGLDRFGEYSKTLVIRYETTEELTELHVLLLSALKDFLCACGVADSEAFMKSDANFKHALQITPHITICKGYTGDIPQVELEPLTLEVMKFVYEK